jgi:hypothetical protein
MAIPVVTAFIEDDTIRIVGYSYNDSETLEACTSATCTLTDSAGTVHLNASAMTTAATGVYDSSHTIEAADPHGEWTGVCKFVDGSGGTAKNTNIRFSLKVS